MSFRTKSPEIHRLLRYCFRSTCFLGEQEENLAPFAFSCLGILTLPLLIQRSYNKSMMVALLLQYSMSSLNRDKNIRYPLARLAHDRQDLYYALRFWLSPDFVYVTSETLEGFANTECQCGASLIHEKHRDVFYPNAHFPLRCPECNNPFDPNARLFHLRCAFTGDSSTVVGGTTFRFCVEIDCGKCIPRDDVSFHPDLHRLCSNVLGCEFIEVGSVY